MCVLRGKTTRTPDVRGVFRHYVPRKGLHPCAVKATVPITKRRGPRGHAFPVLLSFERLAKAGGK